MKQYYIYILTNSYNTVFYIGITNDLTRRVYEHKNKLVDGFTKKYNLTKLVFYEIYSDPLSAISREKALKNLLREKKILLIKENNPTFSEIIV